MAKPQSPTAKEWFDNCGGWRPLHRLDILRRGIAMGLLDLQDDYGMTALSFAVSSDWLEGVQVLLRAGANTELRYFQTGATVLLDAVQKASPLIVKALVAAGANPDAPNYWGLTARAWPPCKTANYFDHILPQATPLPPTHIQNAEHLADHYYPRFKIPDRVERETLQVGQAVDLCVFGPRADNKQDKVKVRISARHGERPHVRYTATVETPSERIHLAEGTTVVEFGPEHVATVYIAKPGKNKK